MPTYEDLRSYFDESKELQGIARAASEIPIVSGFTLSVDPFWSVLYDIEDGVVDGPPAGPGFAMQSGVVSVLDYEYARKLTSPSAHLRLAMSPANYHGHHRRDLYRKVGEWEKVQKFAHGQVGRDRLPVVMTVVHRPLRPPAVERKEDDREALRRLVSIVKEAPVIVRVEERPSARLALAAGEAIHTPPSKSGTLGGFLRDSSTGDSYGVTCAHVAQNGGLVTDSAGLPIGTCSADTTLVPLSAGLACDPVNLAVPSPFPGNGPNVNTLDCALVRLSLSASPWTMVAIAPTICPGQNVVVHGAVTGRTRHKLGSLCMSYGFTAGGHSFCFRDAIELLPQPWGPFGGILGQMMTTLPTQGDSGSWLLTDDQPPDWAGVFFGEDGQRGFCIRATWVHAWAEKEVGNTLTAWIG